MPTVSALTQSFESLWPLSGAEDWDTPGLIAGNPAASVTSVMFTVDVTAAVVDEAIASGVDLLVAHHPYLMRGAKYLPEDQAKGAVLAKAIKAGLAIYAAHTNADVVADGVSDVLAKALGLQNARPLDAPQADSGTGRIGNLTEVTTLGQFAALVARTLPQTATGIRVAGEYDQEIETVAVCGGAGDSFLGLAAAAGADVYLTADLRHHPAQDFREQALISGGPALIDVSHWASEFLWLDVAAQQLRRIYPELPISVCDLRTDPWDFVVTQ